ncbi:MAG TPA: alpha/beta fold hydrolase, partial [bacterium]|nr:alpha/beta fold hydrolase [bacterium]
METEQVAGLRMDRARPQGAAARRPALLLVHGAGHGSWCWENWLGVLPGRGWEAVAPSLRNHPGSRAAPEREFLRETRLQDYVEDVAAVAAHVGRPVVAV